MLVLETLEKSKVDVEEEILGKKSVRFVPN